MDFPNKISRVKEWIRFNKMLFGAIVVLVIMLVAFMISTIVLASRKSGFDNTSLFQPGINDTAFDNIPEGIPWDAAIQGVGLDNDVFESHHKFVVARDGDGDPTKVIKRAVQVVKDGATVWSVDPADITNAKPEDIKCMFFSRDQVPDGQFTNDKDCPGYEAYYGESAAYKFTTTASHNAVRDYDVDTVPWVGLRRVDYRVPVGSDSRQVPSEYADQLPKYTRYII